MKKNAIGELVGGWGEGFVVGMVTEVIKQKGHKTTYRVVWTDGDVMYLQDLSLYRGYLKEQLKKWEKK